MVHFFQPPPAQRTGGLELAINSLESYLRSAGVPVQSAEDFGPQALSNGAVAHFHGLWQPSFLKNSRLCRAARIPYVVSPHGMLEPWAWRHKRWKKWPYFFLFERRYLAGASRLLATSNLEAANLRQFLPHSECCAIPLGLPEGRPPAYRQARQRLGWSAEEKVLLFLSRIHPKKGLHLLLEALAQLGTETIKGLRLVVVGGGAPAYLSRLREFAAARAKQLPGIDWLGEIWGEDKWLYLQGADLFCLPSFSENFGLAVLEALQVGTRVLTTTTCPWDFLPQWNAGFVVQPTAEALRNGLKAFFQASHWTTGQRSELASRASEKFGWEVIGPQYLRLYQSLLVAS